MDQMTREAHGQAADQHAGHQMSKIHDRHAGHSAAMFRDKFWLSLALTIPVVIWSTDIQHWLGYTVPSFSASRFIPPSLERPSLLMTGLCLSVVQGVNLPTVSPA
jgi:Cu2+-exporting ATPase